MSHKTEKRIIDALNELSQGCEDSVDIANKLERIGIKGEARDNKECPIAIYLRQKVPFRGIRVHNTVVSYLTLFGYYDIPMPFIIRQFVLDFDRHGHLTRVNPFASLKK